MSSVLTQLMTTSPSPEAAAAAGIKTTESLGAKDASEDDLEQYSGVTLITNHAKDNSVHLFLLFGFVFVELTPIEPEVLIRFGERYHAPSQNYSFCIYSLDEFIQDVCKTGAGNIFWPRTNKYYKIPSWFQDRCTKALQIFRKK